MSDNCGLKNNPVQMDSVFSKHHETLPQLSGLIEVDVQSSLVLRYLNAFEKLGAYSPSMEMTCI